MPRNMLIINESQVVRKIITSYIQAELNDIVLDSAPSAEEGLLMLSEKKYDLVLSAMEMAVMTGLEIRRRMRKTPINSSTPFIVMTSIVTEAQKERLASMGVEYIIFAPYTAEDLARVINRACNPRKMRQHARYNIPGSKAMIQMNDSRMVMEVLNISLAGLLGELEFHEQYATFWHPELLDIKFPEEYGRIWVENVKAVPCRAWVMSWQDRKMPGLLRIAWSFLDIPPESRKKYGSSPE